MMPNKTLIVKPYLLADRNQRFYYNYTIHNLTFNIADILWLVVDAIKVIIILKTKYLVM